MLRHGKDQQKFLLSFVSSLFFKLYKLIIHLLRKLIDKSIIIYTFNDN